MYIKDENFALWCDFVERDFLENEFEELIKDGKINGATSNPAIFKNAFLTSKAYEEDKEALSGLNSSELYEKLAIKDIQIAADKLSSLYEKGDDGFISIEVDPNLCNDAKGTIEEGKKLFKEIGKENVMIKIPATEAGYEAMEALISEGIHVNATLIFSPKQAKLCVDAFEKGLKKVSGKKPKAVISVFVSRFDRKLDPSLSYELKGKVGIVNATKIYHDIESRGIKEVRTLFASTGVKGDDYPAHYYIEELCFPNSVNTAPLDTIKAYQANGSAIIKTPISQNECENFFAQLKSKGVDIEKVYDELLDEGLKAFVDAYNEILTQIR
jgi:transaldolase